jgi:hypothetical protein
MSLFHFVQIIRNCDIALTITNAFSQRKHIHQVFLLIFIGYNLRKMPFSYNQFPRWEFVVEKFVLGDVLILIFFKIAIFKQ